MKANCWEINKCGRGPGGGRIDELGPCPAAAGAEYDGLNGGVNGGRICWAVAGTLCGDQKQGTFADKRYSCMTCEVYTRIEREESAQFQILVPGQQMHAQPPHEAGPDGSRAATLPSTPTNRDCP